MECFADEENVFGDDAASSADDDMPAMCQHNPISAASRFTMKSLGKNLILIVSRSELLMFHLSRNLMTRRNVLRKLN